MSKRDHYTARDITTSTRTKKVAVNAAAILYSHTIPNVAGQYIIVDIDADGELTKWEAFETSERAHREMDRALANLTTAA